MNVGSPCSFFIHWLRNFNLYTKVTNFKSLGIQETARPTAHRNGSRRDINLLISFTSYKYNLNSKTKVITILSPKAGSVPGDHLLESVTGRGPDKF